MLRKNCFVVTESNIENIIETLESKKVDCVEFQKRYEKRKMSELVEYYKGAEWGIKYAISLIKNKD